MLLVNLASFAGFPTACLQDFIFIINKIILPASRMLTCILNSCCGVNRELGVG